MKIAIVTLRIGSNYGGILQAFALQKYLRDLGHEAILVRIPLGEFKPSLLYLFVKRPIKKAIYLLTRRARFYNRKNNEIEPVYRELEAFITENINPIVKIKNFNELKEKDFDAIVVGSDQIWRPKYFSPYPIENAYLDFTKKWKKIRRIAYAPSFGTSEWEYDEKQSEHCKQLIKNFDAISVREQEGVSLCNKNLLCNATQVLDPTLLISKETYINLFKDKDIPKSSGDLLVYFLDNSEDKKEVKDIISKKYNLTPFDFLSDVKIPFYGPIDKDIIAPSLYTWLRAFYDSEFVVTDSFHGCIFSIIFHKPFIVYQNTMRGNSRMLSLLNIFDLKSRLITNSKDLTLNDFANIDWDKVDIRLNEWRKKSSEFLKNSLNNKL